MEKEKQQIILEKFAYMFEPAEMTDKRYPISYGLAVGDGWYDLIYFTLIQVARIDIDKKFRLTQVKEKFAGLCLYHNLYANENVNNIIQKAQSKSYKICEVCGRDGKVSRKSPAGWIRTLCIVCRKKDGYKIYRNPMMSKVVKLTRKKKV